jgi:hypothetical protein
MLPLAAVAACGTYAGGGYYSPQPDEVYDPYEPLDARIFNDFGRLSVRLNQPAHVAVFEILPGHGVGLVYPAYENEPRVLRSGFSRLILNPDRRYDWYYADYSGGYRRFDDGPRFYFLIASREPLRIGRFQREPGALRKVLGLSRFASIDENRVMADLMTAVVPEQPDEGWITDLLVVWPDRGGYTPGYDYYDYYRDYLVQVYCSDGSIDVVPVELAGYACRHTGGRRPPPAPPSDSTGGGQPGDSVRVPGRRRPEPPTRPAVTDSTPTGGVSRPDAPGGRPRVPRNPLAPAGGEGGEREGGDTEGRVAPPRTRPEAAPRIEERPAPIERQTEGARVEPRRAEPRSEPRAEPRREEPRAEPRRAEPRNEPARPEPSRADPPRAEPRSEPRPAPSPPPAPRNDPPPAPRNDPPPARPAPPPPPPPPAPAPAPSREPASSNSGERSRPRP